MTDDSRPYRQSPEQIMEFNQASKPRQWAMAILKLPAGERSDAYQVVPEKYRGWVRELVEDQLWRKRHRKRKALDQTTKQVQHANNGS